MSVLVAGLGNVFFGDDAFGPEVVRRLQGQAPVGAEIRDYGVRGRDLALRLLQGCRALILVDAVQRGRPPGTLYLLETELGWLGPAAPGSHGTDPASALAWARDHGAQLGELLVVGCEPERLGSPDLLEMGLSPVVQAAVPEAVQMVLRLLEARL